MSHFTSIKTSYRRKSALISALQRIDNGKLEKCVEVHEEKQALLGYDSAAGRKAEIVVRKKNLSAGAYNDIGFSLEADGTYSIQGSDFGTDRHYNNKWLDKLLQTYSACVVEEVAAEQGFNFESREENGEIFITCERSF